MSVTVFDVKKSYGTKMVIPGLSLEFRQGVVGLLGPNGAGKTTLLRMICDLLKPTAGKICCDGEEIHHMGERYRDKLGYVPQKIGYYPWFTGQRYLEYLSCLKGLEKSKAKERIDYVLEQVALSEERNKRIRAYSGGMLQRLGIAQALLNDPEILILDEPTAGLDPKERVRFRNLIAKLTKDRLIILSTHIVEDIEDIANHIIILNAGKIELQGTKEELVKRMEGKVYSVRIKQSQIEEYTGKYLVSNTYSDGEDVELRIICDNEVPESAFSVKGTLEDLYLYLFMDYNL